MKISVLLRCLFLAVVALTTVQCGEESESSKLSKLITITPSPESPLVIDADITLNKGSADEITYKAPWTRFRFRVANDSGQPFRILTFSFVVTGVKGGATVKKEGGFDMGNLPEAIYGDFTGSYDAIKEVVLYLDGLPDADSFVYTVEFQALGYFLDSNNEPINRLDVSTIMVTQ